LALVPPIRMGTPSSLIGVGQTALTASPTGSPRQALCRVFSAASKAPRRVWRSRPVATEVVRAPAGGYPAVLLAKSASILDQISAAG